MQFVKKIFLSKTKKFVHYEVPFPLGLDVSVLEKLDICLKVKTTIARFHMCRYAP